MSSQQSTIQDPRILASKQSMYAALFQLLENNRFTKITVRDICRTAEVSRTTFYTHFLDKYELLRKALDQASEDLRLTSDGCPEKEIHDLLDYVNKNRKVFQNLNDQNEELLHLLNDVSVSSLEDFLENAADFSEAVPSVLHSVFLAGGRAWLLLWWIKTDCKVPKEQMEDYLVSMLRQ